MTWFGLTGQRCGVAQCGDVHCSICGHGFLVGGERHGTLICWLRRIGTELRLWRRRVGAWSRKGNRA